jgi:hypothetical protein
VQAVDRIRCAGFCPFGSFRLLITMYFATRSRFVLMERPGKRTILDYCAHGAAGSRNVTARGAAGRREERGQGLP